MISHASRKPATFYRCVSPVSVTSDRSRPIHREFIRRLLVITENPISLVVNGGQRLKKLLLNVTIQRSFGPIRVVMSAENTVQDLTKATVEIYRKEGRRPLLSKTDPMGFELHYSQFCLERLNPEERLINLESRNFHLCLKPTIVDS